MTWVRGSPLDDISLHLFQASKDSSCYYIMLLVAAINRGIASFVTISLGFCNRGAIRRGGSKFEGNLSLFFCC